MTKILFICKKRSNYGSDDSTLNINSSYGSYGLMNSCLLVKKALETTFPDDIEAKVVSVIDNNAIDKEVHDYRPSHVIIEALWVVPEKFLELIPLHPHVKWVVRIHSKTPFLSNEGVAFNWMGRYLDIKKKYPHSMFLSGNDYEFCQDMSDSYNKDFTYLPNVYLVDKGYKFVEPRPDTRYVDIGCFGAIRPMKNQMEQAVAAVLYANEVGKTLRFHMNGSRTEQRGEEVLKNITAFLFGTGHELILHGWYPHAEFVELVKKMDVGLQVSFSESFNIVAADFVTSDVPIVVSDDIRWASSFFKTSTTNAEEIKHKIAMAIKWRKLNLQYLNKLGLRKYNYLAVDAWMNFIFEQ